MGGFMHKLLVTLIALFAGVSVQNSAWAGEASLVWDPPVNADGTIFSGVASYKVYSGTASETYANSVDVGSALRHTVTGLTEGQTYYFATTTVDSSGVESVFSNELVYTVPVKTVYYTITASAGAGGSISPSGATSVLSGANRTFTISPASGYRIGSVVVDGVSKGAISSFAFSNVTANHTISASFVPVYTITATADTGGAISPSGAVSVSSGANRTFTVTPAAGYRIRSVLVDGMSKGAISSFAFSNVTANHTISASFVRVYTITASAGTGGAISPSGAVSVSSGANRTFTVTPAAGYRIRSVLVDGVSKGAISSFAFSNVTANHTIAASFVPVYMITVEAGMGGSISPSGKVLISSGASRTFAITPASGYRIRSVTVDGIFKGTISSYTFSNVTANHRIWASFVRVYTITAAAGTGGSISPSGATSVLSGANRTFKITPAAGYRIRSVFVDGVSKGAISSYTFSNVTANHTISAGFVRRR